MIIENKFSYGAVVIGRNEGQRLISCLQSLIKNAVVIVYVDSGSTDGSIETAQKLGVATVSLDMSIPFTAARARNEGVAYILEVHPNMKYIQFVDGDCEVRPRWMQTAFEFLESYTDYAVVCGRRRERFPERSIYNQLCDIEWSTPVGDALACGGDAMFRVMAFKRVEGFNTTLIAGEEPELCFRIREKGWKIRRMDEEMTLHDAAMTKLGQWWTRCKRAGYAYASGYYLHGQSKEHFNIKEVSSILVWGILLPILLVTLTIFDPYFLLGFLLYPLQITRLTLMDKTKLCSARLALYYAMSNMMGKFPQGMGMVQFVVKTIKKQQGTLIEYK